MEETVNEVKEDSEPSKFFELEFDYSGSAVFRCKATDTEQAQAFLHYLISSSGGQVEEITSIKEVDKLEPDTDPDVKGKLN